MSAVPSPVAAGSAAPAPVNGCAPCAVKEAFSAVATKVCDAVKAVWNLIKAAFSAVCSIPSKLVGLVRQTDSNSNSGGAAASGSASSGAASSSATAATAEGKTSFWASLAFWRAKEQQA